MRMRLEWLANLRPDALYAIHQIAQVPEMQFNAQRGAVIKLLNETIRKTPRELLPLYCPALDVKSLRIFGFSDTAYAKNDDLSSQLGRLIMHTDNSARIYILSFKS